MPPIDHLLLIASVLLVLSVIASRTSGALGVPALVLFLAIGMLAGSDGFGGIEFEDPALAQSLGVVALVLILFAGGLDTEWRVIRPVLWSGLALSTLGVLLTTAVLAAFLTLALGYSLLDGLLLGAIVSSTDAAAVFAVMRARNVGLRGDLKGLLELESGSNDPMAVFLTLSMIGLAMDPAASVGALVPRFVQQMAVGAALGYGMARLTVFAVNRINLQYEGLYPVLTLSLILLTYGLTSLLGGNGFLAVYVTGLVMGRHDFIHKGSVIRFHDGLGWLMQIAMFVALGLLVFPSRLPAVAREGLLVALVLMVVARPAAVFATLAVSRWTWAERLLVSWVGLRGAVPIILATFPLVAGVPQADLFFNVVFFIVLTSVALQGSTIPLAARWLGLTEADAREAARGPEAPPAQRLTDRLAEVRIAEGARAAGRRIVDLGLPRDCLIVAILRQQETIVPGGGTVLEAGDSVVLLAEPSALPQVRSILSAPAGGEPAAAP